MSGKLPMKPAVFVAQMLDEVANGGVLIRKVPGAGGDRDYIMATDTKTVGLLLAAGIDVDENDEEGEIILTKREVA